MTITPMDFLLYVKKFKKSLYKMHVFLRISILYITFAAENITN